MNGFSTLSWTAFFIGILLIGLLWYLLCKTTIGKNILEIETNLKATQWTRLFAVAAIILFIMVNPFSHLIVSAVFVLSYLFITQKSLFGYNIFGSSTTGFSGNHDIEKAVQLNVSCSPIQGRETETSMRTLKKILFSFPYLMQNFKPEINYLSGEYRVKLELTSSKYISSLVENLKSANFEVLKME